MTRETQELTEELRETNKQLELVLKRLEELHESQQADRKVARRHRIGTALLAMTMFAVLFLGVNEINQRNRQTAAEDRQRERAARLSCENANNARADIRASIIETLLVIDKSSGNPGGTAELIEDIQDRLAVTLPDRICDPQEDP